MPVSPFFSLSLAPDFRRALSYLYFHLLSAFLGVLHAPQRAPRIFPLAYARRRLAAASSAVLPRLSTSRGWANSFKSRCGAGNSANPLRIHRAPLANSSLAPNIFLSAHPFTAHPAHANDRLRLSRFPPLPPHPISCFPIGPFSQLSNSCRPFLATRLRILRKCSYRVLNEDAPVSQFPRFNREKIFRIVLTNGRKM